MDLPKPWVFSLSYWGFFSWVLSFFHLEFFFQNVQFLSLNFKGCIIQLHSINFIVFTFFAILQIIDGQQEHGCSTQNGWGKLCAVSKARDPRGIGAACPGDSGSPLVTWEDNKWTLIGLLSNGARLAVYLNKFLVHFKKTHGGRST